MKFIRSRAPLRIGLAGGGTDVSPYSDLYGGAILNATINLYANTTIELLANNILVFESIDQNASETFEWQKNITYNGGLKLLVGVYNYMQQHFNIPQQGIKLTTHVDAPLGSGLGTSSTLVVTIVGAFVEWLHLPLSEYDIALLAYKIERNYLGLAGGKQDQYAATFGGFNFMEFLQNDNVIVNPLRIKNTTLFELENNIVLYFTDSSRESAAIITEQVKNVSSNNSDSINAMHQLKAQATQMKEALLKGKLNEIGTILNFGFEQKRKMAANISNNNMDTIYQAALAAGASGGKISGAGGGGFMFFYCPGNAQYKVAATLNTFGGYVKPFNFTSKGLITWSI